MSREPEVLFVGMKPPMSYVLGAITVFSKSDIKEVMLKARGQAINTIRNRFMKELNVSKISIGTEEMPSREKEIKTETSQLSK